MSSSSEVHVQLADAWIPKIYADQVRSQRTRSYELAVPARENPATIQYTLLGIELKVGKRRFACPDLALARYLRTFARLGCTEFAVPYDITKISDIADELEIAWHRTLLIIDAETESLSVSARSRFRNGILREIRNEIGEIGAGPIMPEFVMKTSKNG